MLGDRVGNEVIGETDGLELEGEIDGGLVGRVGKAVVGVFEAGDRVGGVGFLVGAIEGVRLGREEVGLVVGLDDVGREEGILEGLEVFGDFVGEAIGNGVGKLGVLDGATVIGGLVGKRVNMKTGFGEGSADTTLILNELGSFSS